MTDTVQVCNSNACPIPVAIVSGGGAGGAGDGLTDAQLRAAPVEVSGSVDVANWPAGWNVAVSNFPAAFQVSNFPATQPVSIAAAVAVTGPLTDAQLRAAAVPVSGNFWQATQPVSIAATVAVSGPLTDAQIRATALPVSGPLTDTQLRATPVSVTGGLTDAQLRATAVPVSLAALPALVAGAALIGKVGLDQTTPGTTNGISVASIGATTVASGKGVASAGCQRVTVASDNDALAVTAPALAKGTQSANGFSVQPLRDAGRASVTLTAEFAFAQVAETLLSLIKNTDGANAAGATSFLIPNGKKFRIQAISLEVEALGSGTAPQRAYLRLRRNTAGATVVGSALAAVWACVNNPAVVKTGTVQHFDIPDGYEMNGDGTATYGFSLETPRLGLDYSYR